MVAKTSLKQKVAKGAVWSLCERLSCQAVGFVVGMILARLLTPSDYGTVALLSIFIALAGVLADSGFGTALVQKKDATDLDFNSVFYASLALSSICYVILFAIAPWVAEFYKTPELVPILRVIAVCLVFNSINSVQNAELQRKFLFNLSFRISLITTVISSGTGVALAFRGYGPWALVWSQVAGGFAGVIARWFIIAWRPRLMFSFASLKGLFSFGWKMTVSALLDTGYNNLYGLLIGKLYSKADLAYVNKGRHLPDMVMGSVVGTLGQVAYPALAQLQDDVMRAREAMRRLITCSTFVVFPMMAGIAVCADLLIPLLFGNRWEGAILYVKIACFGAALWPFHVINLKAISAMGRSDIFLTLEIIKKVLGLTLLVLSIRQGVLMFVCVTTFVGGPLGVIINVWPNKRLMGYTLAMQLKDVIPVFLVTCMMYAACWGVGQMFSVQENVGLATCVVILQIVVGVMTYVGLAVICKMKTLYEVVEVLKLRRAK